MPVDPNIITEGIARATAQNAQPQESVYERVQKLKALRDNEKVRAMQMQGAQLSLDTQKQAVADDQAYKATFANPNATFSDRARINPKAAIEFEKSKLEIGVKQTEAQLKEIELTGKRHAEAAQVVSAAKKFPPGPQRDMYWTGVVVPKLKQLGVPDGEIPAQGAPDDNYIDAQMAEGTQLATQLSEARLKAAQEWTQRLQGLEELRKQQEFAVTLPGKQAESQGHVMTLAERQANGGLTAQQKATLDQQKAQAAQQAKYQSARLSLEKQAQEGLNLTPEGLDAAAMAYAKTGQLPPMGMGRGAGATRMQIINRAAQLNPNLDVASNKADYDANKQSLTGLQKMYDSVTAFENTANKNLDLMLNSTQKLVDSGSPLVNIPLRKLQGAAIGSEGQAVYNAARRVAINEIAKITNNPTLAGQLSDSARHEVESLIPEEATIKQIYAVAKTLKQDMENRRTSLEQQMGGIRQRIGGKKQEQGTNTTNVKARKVWNDQAQRFE